MGVNPADEAWFLQVLRRLYEGETLYRDVFFGVPPLSVFVSIPLVWLFGPEILVLKLVLAISYASLLLLGWWGLGLLGVGRWLRLTCVALSFVLAPPFPGSPYHVMSMAFFAGSMVAFIARFQGRQDPRVPWDTLAGFSAGLAFLAKHNVGALALAATVLAGFLTLPQPRRAVVRGAIAFGVTSLFGLVPVVLQRAGKECLEYLVLAKGHYVRQAALPYFTSLSTAIEKVGQALGSLNWQSLVPLGQLFALALPLVVAVGWVLLLVCKRRSSCRLELALGAFFLAAWMAIYPRFDVYHVVASLPVFLWGAVITVHAVQSHVASSLTRGQNWALLLRGVVALALLVSVVRPFLGLSRGEVVLTFRPHFRGALLPVAWEQKIQLQGPLLQARAAESPGFLVSPFAGFWYLAARFRNPSPFDYPMSTAFGQEGQEQVIRALETGSIQWVCWERGTWPLRPQRLEAYVIGTWHPGEDLGACQVYRPPLSSP